MKWFILANLMGTTCELGSFSVLTRLVQHMWGCLCSYIPMRTTLESLCFWGLRQPVRTIVLGWKAQTIWFPQMFSSHSLRNGAQSISPRCFSLRSGFQDKYSESVASYPSDLSQAQTKELVPEHEEPNGCPSPRFFTSGAFSMPIQPVCHFSLQKKWTQISKFCYSHSLLITQEEQGLR